MYKGIKMFSKSYFSIVDRETSVEECMDEYEKSQRKIVMEKEYATKKFYKRLFDTVPILWQQSSK